MATLVGTVVAFLAIVGIIMAIDAPGARRRQARFKEFLDS